MQIAKQTTALYALEVFLRVIHTKLMSFEAYCTPIMAVSFGILCFSLHIGPIVK